MKFKVGEGLAGMEGGLYILMLKRPTNKTFNLPSPHCIASSLVPRVRTAVIILVGTAITL